MPEIIANNDFVNLFPKIHHPKIEKLFYVKHHLTHQTIYACFYKLSAKQKINLAGKSFINVDTHDLNKYPVPRLFDKFLNYLNLHSNQK